MADDIHEVEEITTICNALVINIGTLNERTVASMIKAGKMANHLNHPVAVSYTHLDTAPSLFSLYPVLSHSTSRDSLKHIKYNYSSIHRLYSSL